MSQFAGDRMPPPLRFEFGADPAEGAGPHPALVLVTVDESGAPRVAVIARSELTAPDERRLMLSVESGSTTCTNLAARRQASVWCVLDGAAYTIQSVVETVDAAEERTSFGLRVTGVWRDFRPDAPMTAGPTYKRMEAGAD